MRLPLADPRSQDWWLCCSPLVPATIIAVYLLLVKKWGPAFMAQRAPFKIEPVIIVYNVAQVAVCFFIFWEVRCTMLRLRTQSPLYRRSR